MAIVNILFITSLSIIWFLLILNIILTYFGYKYYLDVNNRKISILKEMNYFPKVSILIPAHNEGVVIGKTIESMLNLDYPKDKLEIIVINDNSKDNTKEIIESYIEKDPSGSLMIANVPKELGGKGKSAALNYGYSQSSGDFIIVYDADNTPNSLAVRYLVYEITTNDNYGAVIGKFRTRNRDKNLLTRFINIETLSFQWMAQAGRWKLLKLCTIPGTNFIIRKSIVETIGGWDPDAIAEDTEISFRIYQLGYKIAFMPLAETYEQEPETIKVWFKQRTRWVDGNIYVLKKFLREVFKYKNPQILFDLVYFFSVYILFLTSTVLSDIIMIYLIFSGKELTLDITFFPLWVLGYITFILQVGITLSFEKGESFRKNWYIIGLMYFTYCQMWLLVSIKGLYKNITTSLFKKEIKWYKTERF